MKPVLAIFLLWAVPALAGSADDLFASCTFTRECLEEETCTDTDFQMEIRHDDTLGFLMETIAEEIDGLVFDNRANEATSTLIGQTDTAYHMLTIRKDGEARYSVHMEGPMAITYIGKCEVNG